MSGSSIVGIIVGWVGVALGILVIHALWPHVDETVAVLGALAVGLVFAAIGGAVWGAFRDE